MKKLYSIILLGFVLLLSTGSCKAQLKMISYIYEAKADIFIYMVQDSMTKECAIWQAQGEESDFGMYFITPSVLDEDQYKALLPMYGVMNEDDVFFQAAFGNSMDNLIQLNSSVNNVYDDEEIELSRAAKKARGNTIKPKKFVPTIRQRQ